jgi:chorismate-pyruvate lyase
MAKGIKDIREQARKLLEKAEKLEEQAHIKIGKMIAEHSRTEFRNFDLERFKIEVSKILDDEGGEAAR